MSRFTHSQRQYTAGVFRGITVAIKELSLYQMKESLLPMFWDEIRLLSCMHHPHVCLFVGFSMRPKLRVVMEYCENGTLGDAAPNMDVPTRARVGMPLSGARVHTAPRLYTHVCCFILVAPGVEVA